MRTSVLIWSCVVVLGCSTGKRDVSMPIGESAPPRDTEPQELDSKPSVDNDASNGTRSPIDPIAVRLLLDRSAKAPEAADHGVRFELVQMGASRPWLIGAVNRSDQTVQVQFDPRLLSFDVESTAEKQRRPQIKTCQLPAAMVPTRSEPQQTVELKPGEGVVETIDPRLFCIEGSRAIDVVPGSKISPRFGWPEKTKTVWKAGKSQKVPLEQSEPFVVKTSDKSLSIKELKGQPFEIPAYYEETVIPGATPRTQTFELRMLGGSDAGINRDATVSVALKNRSNSAELIYFRRELLSFSVIGPEGSFRCEPGPDQRAPDRQAFSRLGAGESTQAASRMVELCPFGSFRTPGLYLISAALEANQAGASFGLKAFTGNLEASGTALVRVQKTPEGTSPLWSNRNTQRVKVGEASENSRSSVNENQNAR